MLAADGAESKSSSSLAGQWLQHRGDRALTGRSLLKVDITTPRIQWKTFLGARETLVHLRWDGGEAAEVPLPSAGEQAELFQQTLLKWTRESLDLEGDREPLQKGGPIGKFLPDQPGLQMIQFDPAGYCLLMTRDKGRWVEVWRSEKIGDVMQGLNTVTGDFDGDGKLEVAFTPWTNLHVLDLATGKLKGKARFYQDDAPGDGRPYGWFGAFDLDGDGKKEFIVISDTQCYISVLGWRRGKLGLLWGRRYQTKTDQVKSERGCIVHPGPNPIQDVDGDGLPEIVVSHYAELPPDARGQVQGRWQVDVIDGKTGKNKLELRDQRLVGLCDIDDDRIAELFCTHTAPAGDSASGLSLHSFKKGRLATRWRLADAVFQTQPLRAPPDCTHNASAAGSVTLLAGAVEPGSKPVFFTRKVIDKQALQIEVTGWRADTEGRVRPLGTFAGPGAEAIATLSENKSECGLLIRLQVPRDQKASLRVARVRAKRLCSRRVSVPPHPVVVGPLRPKGPPVVLVQEAGERLVALRLAGDQGEPRVLWDRPGRGMHEGSHHRTGGATFGGVVLADLHGDGNRAVLAGTRGPHDQARLIALDPDGKEIWHHDFDTLPGAPPGFTLPGLSHWFAGHFTNPKREDVLAAVKSGVSTRLVLLDGRTGKAIWYKLAGGMFMAVYDHDGDGLDDALSTCWSEIQVIRGATGRTLLKVQTSPPNIFGEKLWPTDAYSCAVDLLGRGKPQILYWPSYAARGLVDLDGKLIWKTPEDRLFFGTPSVYPGIGDLDGDGKLEIFSPGDHPSPKSQKCRCYDGTTGRIKWELAIENPPGGAGSAVTVDIDCDGRDECLFPMGNTLYAVGTTRNGRAGEVRWKRTFPGSLGPVSLAKVASNGAAQVLVVCDDGYLYGVGGAKK